MTVSFSSCWRLVGFVVSYCCDIAKCEEMSHVRHETTVDSLFIWCPASCKAFCRKNSAVIRNKAGTFSAHDQYEMNMDNVWGMKMEIMDR